MTQVEYLTQADATEVLTQLTGWADKQARLGDRCGTPMLGSSDLAIMRHKRKAKAHVDAVYQAFNDAIKKNGGAFPDYTTAYAATMTEFEVSRSGWVTFFGGLLSLISIAFPQTKLFIFIFKLLFDIWWAKNNPDATIAPVT